MSWLNFAPKALIQGSSGTLSARGRRNFAGQLHPASCLHTGESPLGNGDDLSIQSALLPQDTPACNRLLKSTRRMCRPWSRHHIALRKQEVRLGACYQLYLTASDSCTVNLNPPAIELMRGRGAWSYHIARLAWDVSGRPTHQVVILDANSYHRQILPPLETRRRKRLSVSCP